MGEVEADDLLLQEDSSLSKPNSADTGLGEEEEDGML